MNKLGGTIAPRIGVFLLTFLVGYSITKSLIIDLAISLVTTSLFYFVNKRREDKSDLLIAESISEIIDNVISAIQSGLSLNEALSSLSVRGPTYTREYFADFSIDITQGVGFERSIHNLQKQLQNQAADLFFESLIFARSLGGGELLGLLRQLGRFTREDLILRKEISSKQSWVKNSAHISAAAPWILLLLLSGQPTTAEAFSQPGGILVLSSGVIATLLAYIWMEKLSHLPQPHRIFGVEP
jgi:tight adherence protein B